MEVVDFCGGFFGHNQKIRWKIRQPKQKKIRQRLHPPKIHQPGPKIRRKTLPTNPPVKPSSGIGCFKCTPGFSGLRRRLVLGGLQSMDSGTLFGCLLGMVEAPMLKCTCNGLGATGGRDEVAVQPSRQHFWSKAFVLRKHPNNNKNDPPRNSAKSGSPRKT